MTESLRTSEDLPCEKCSSATAGTSRRRCETHSFDLLHEQPRRVAEHPQHSQKRQLLCARTAQEVLDGVALEDASVESQLELRRDDKDGVFDCRRGALESSFQRRKGATHASEVGTSG